MMQRIDNPSRKAEIVEKILADLPAWFGLPESTKAYIEEAKELPLWAYYREDEALGFVTRKETAPHTAEIHCMGVLKAHHRQGIGAELLAALEEDSRRKYKFLQVKTVAEGHYPEYDRTIAFYRSCGFVELEVFPDLWDPWNPCLILVKSLMK